MKFNELDRKMRLYETAHDHCVLPDIFIVARLDGRSFTRLTKEESQLEVPFDLKFRDYMVDTVKHLMNCGFNIVYGYTESDEISLLFHPLDDAFGRKVRKLNSVLAGEASGKFTLLFGKLACFDCRISQLPNRDVVVDYFRWRSEDAHRNSLNAHCYWALRKAGLSARDATERLRGVSVSEKNELLFQYGTNFNDTPKWHRRGIGLKWETVDKQGANPVTGEKSVFSRRHIAADFELPMGDEYSSYIRDLLESSRKD
ncbi:guanylyltransferase [bacterium]|nr:guanylyltransferase [bacterium]